MQKDTEQRETKMVMHASSVGRRRDGEGHQVSDKQEHEVVYVIHAMEKTKLSGGSHER